MHEIVFKRTHPEAKSPEYKTDGSAAFDFSLVEDVEIPAGEMKKVRTGLIIKTPEHHMLMIVSRSSNPLKKGIDLANSAGIIDSDYAGPEDEIFLILKNITNETVSLRKHDRIAQGIFVPVTRGTFKETEKILEENRGGHGSTGR